MRLRLSLVPLVPLLLAAALLLPLTGSSNAAAAAAPPPSDPTLSPLYATCLLDPVCRALYHQNPPNEAVFRHIYRRVASNGDNRTLALRARVAHVDVCPRNERYEVVTDASGVDQGTCVCPDTATYCGPVTPHNNAVVMLACFVATGAVCLHTGKTWILGGE